jgi:hypothetical protein
MELILRCTIDKNRILRKEIENGGSIKSTFCKQIRDHDTWESISYSDQNVAYKYYYHEASNTLVPHGDNPGKNSKIEDLILKAEIVE